MSKNVMQPITILLHHMNKEFNFTTVIDSLSSIVQCEPFTRDENLNVASFFIYEKHASCHYHDECYHIKIRPDVYIDEQHWDIVKIDSVNDPIQITTTSKVIRKVFLLDGLTICMKLLNSNPVWITMFIDSSKVEKNSDARKVFYHADIKNPILSNESQSAIVKKSMHLSIADAIADALRVHNRGKSDTTIASLGNIKNPFLDDVVQVFIRNIIQTSKTLHYCKIDIEFDEDGPINCQIKPLTIHDVPVTSRAPDSKIISNTNPLNHFSSSPSLSTQWLYFDILSKRHEEFSMFMRMFTSSTFLSQYKDPIKYDEFQHNNIDQLYVDPVKLSPGVVVSMIFARFLHESESELLCASPTDTFIVELKLFACMRRMAFLAVEYWHMEHIYLKNGELHTFDFNSDQLTCETLCNLTMFRDFTKSLQSDIAVYMAIYTFLRYHLRNSLHEDFWKKYLHADIVSVSCCE